MDRWARAEGGLPSAATRRSRHRALEDARQRPTFALCALDCHRSYRRVGPSHPRRRGLDDLHPVDDGPAAPNPGDNRSRPASARRGAWQQPPRPGHGGASRAYPARPDDRLSSGPSLADGRRHRPHPDPPHADPPPPARMGSGGAGGVWLQFGGARFLQADGRLGAERRRSH